MLLYATPKLNDLSSKTAWGAQCSGTGSNASASCGNCTDPESSCKPGGVAGSPCGVGTDVFAANCLSGSSPT